MTFNGLGFLSDGLYKVLLKPHFVQHLEAGFLSVYDSFATRGLHVFAARVAIAATQQKVGGIHV